MFDDERREVGSGVGVSGRREMCRELRVDGLSAEEWNYVFGLFLADGYSCVAKCRRKGRKHVGQYCQYFVGFCFQGDEEELACRLMELLRRAGLNPSSDRRKKKRKNMIEVMTSSKRLLYFLPNKKALRDDAVARRTFFESNRLYEVGFGVPFLAGLMDGDGSCWVYARDDCCFGSVSSGWEFSQTRYMFLVDYVKKFVESLAPNGVRVDDDRVICGGRKRGFGSGVVKVRFRKSGVAALLDAGIAGYSWKVARWLGAVDEARSERAKYYTVGQVAGVLKVSKHIVRRSLETGMMKYVRREVRRGKRRTTLSYYYVPIDEVEKYKAVLAREREIEERVKGDGMRLTEVAATLGIPRKTLSTWYWRGKLKAALVSEGGRRYLVVPRDEVERLMVERDDGNAWVGD